MQQQFSKTALILCCAFIFLTGIFYYPKWEQKGTEATISWDVSGYYWYLPAIFLYKDLKQLRFADSILKKYQPTPDFQQAYRHPSGTYVLKYSMGQAVMFAPFFFIGHVYALLTAFPDDGFSLPYQMAIGLGMLVYSFIGLWVLRKTLLLYFTDKAVAATLLVIVFATNYLNYAAIDAAMTHNTLFTLYSCLLYCTICFYRSPGWRMAVGMGACMGLLVLIRPTEMLSVLIPMAWGYQKGWLFMRRNGRYFLLAALLVFLITGLQLVYWKSVTGTWLFYSYGNQGFDWLHPQFVNGLFSYRAGWLVYTPAMLLVIPGCWFLFKKKRAIALWLLVFFILFMYGCFSWAQWWYAGSMGQRAMIQCYPVLAFPLAALFERTRLQSLIGVLLAGFIMLCVLYNLWLTHQAHKGGLFKAGEMTKAYFWSVLGRLEVPAQTAFLLDNPEKYTGDTSHPLKKSILYNGEQQLVSYAGTEEYAVPVNPQVKWLQGIFLVSTPEKEWTVWKMPQAVMKFYKEDVLIKTAFVRISRVLGNGETASMYVDAQNTSGANRITLSVWNAGSDQPTIVRRIGIKYY